MKRVTKNNLLKLVDMMKEYQETENEKLKITINNFIENVINNFIENVINKDKKYYSKLKNFNFDNEIIKYLI